MNQILVPKDVRIAVIGDVHEHDEQFFKIIDRIKPDGKTWFVSVGDVIDKGFGTESFNKITCELMNYQKCGFGFAVRGNHEIKVLKSAKKEGKLSKELAWWKDQPLCLRFKFPNDHTLTVVHAGICPNHTLSDLYRDYSVCYVREVDEDGKMISLVWKEIDGKKTLTKPRSGINWHELYQGKFGYVASGHNAQKDGEAKYYGYSCNLDSAVYDTGKLTCQVFNNRGGLDEKVIVTGGCFKTKLNINYE